MKQSFLPITVLFFLAVCGQPLNAQWTNLGSDITATQRGIASVFPVNDQIIWGLTWHTSSFIPTHEFTKTTDGGLSWMANTYNGVSSNQFPIYIYAHDDQTAWLATADEEDPIQGHMYKTTNGGGTWVQQHTAFTGTNETPAGVWFWGEEEGVAFGATCYNNFNDQITIYTTDNGGENWSKVGSSNMPIQLPGEGMCLFNLSGFFSVIDDTVWFGTSKDRVFRSVDRGHSWEAFSVGFGSNKSIPSLCFKDETTGIAISSSPFQLRRTVDGGETWLPLSSFSSNLTGLQIEYIPETDNTWLAVGAFNGNKNYISYDNGDSWESFDSNIEAWAVEFLNPQTGFAGSFTTNPTLPGIFKWSGQNLSTTTRELLADDFELLTSPNPVSNFLQIHLPEDFTQSFEVSLFTSQGQLVLNQKLIAGGSLDVRNLPPGLYVVKIAQQRKVFVGSFLKI